MAKRHRRSGFGGTAARIPQLLVSIGCALVAFTGVWLWWFGQDIGNRVVTNSLTDPYAPQVWMRRLHSIGSYALLGVIVFMILTAFVRQEAGRAVFLIAFAAFIGVGIWVGFQTDWQAARLWSETGGGKIRAGLDLGSGTPLPSSLRTARVHLSIVPAALLVVALGSIYHYQRN